MIDSVKEKPSWAFCWVKHLGWCWERKGWGMGGFLNKSKKKPASVRASLRGDEKKKPKKPANGEDQLDVVCLPDQWESL